MPSSEYYENILLSRHSNKNNIKHEESLVLGLRLHCNNRYCIFDCDTIKSSLRDYASVMHNKHPLKGEFFVMSTLLSRQLSIGLGLGLLLRKLQVVLLHLIVCLFQIVGRLTADRDTFYTGCFIYTIRNTFKLKPRRLNRLSR